MSAESETKYVVKKVGNAVYRWCADEQVLWKEVMPMRGMRAVATNVKFAHEIDDRIKEDIEYSFAG